MLVADYKGIREKQKKLLTETMIYNLDKTASGQICGKDFAGKSPKDLVALLVDNKDPKKRLSPSYAGTIDLDGCFTVQGGAMENDTKLVWELLKAKGIKNCKVKGNLGAAATRSRTWWVSSA